MSQNLCLAANPSTIKWENDSRLLPLQFMLIVGSAQLLLPPRAGALLQKLEHLLIGIAVERRESQLMSHLKWHTEFRPARNFCNRFSPTRVRMLGMNSTPWQGGIWICMSWATSRQRYSALENKSGAKFGFYDEDKNALLNNKKGVHPTRILT